MATVKKGLKKAQEGEDIKVSQKDNSSGSTYKYRSTDGNYKTKIKWKGKDATKPSSIVQRRTIKGFLTGAPKAEGKYDMEKFNRKNGGPIKKKMKNGGSLTALKASTKRDKGIDPKGAYTTVQKKTLAGAKGKAKLTADKQLGATKMAKRGMKISKKK